MASPEGPIQGPSQGGIPPPGQGETASEGRLFVDQRANQGPNGLFLQQQTLAASPGEAARKVDRALKATSEA
jgi:hypothetical protein